MTELTFGDVMHSLEVLVEAFEELIEPDDDTAIATPYELAMTAAVALDRSGYQIVPGTFGTTTAPLDPTTGEAIITRLNRGGPLFNPSVYLEGDHDPGPAA